LFIGAGAAGGLAGGAFLAAAGGAGAALDGAPLCAGGADCPLKTAAPASIATGKVYELRRFIGFPQAS
jgi:hypothetical protein